MSNSVTAAVPLRGHHLLCLLTYRGSGYSKDFVDNFSALAERLSKGAPIKIVAGYDAVCDGLKAASHETCKHKHACTHASVNHRDDLALHALRKTLKDDAVSKGGQLILTEDKTRELRRHFILGSIRIACHYCTWHNLCTRVARKNYAEVKFMPQARP